MFPIITSEKQKAFEAIYEKTCYALEIPDICGYCGRGCRQMNKSEGANRMLCTYCPLSEFCKKDSKFEGD